MSALDRLREAARVLRGRATAATNAVGSTAWARQGEDWNESDGVTHTVASAEYAAAGALYEEVADYIATVDPLVGLALADLLDTAGADLWAHGPLCSCGGGCHACDDSLWQPHARRALAIADSILGVRS